MVYFKEFAFYFNFEKDVILKYEILEFKSHFGPYFKIYIAVNQYDH